LGIGGGIITRKLLFTVFLIASLSLGGISAANAVEQGTVQTQTSNTDTVKNSSNTQNDNTNILEETAKTQESAEKSVKTAENAQSKKSTNPTKVQNSDSVQTVTTQNTNTIKTETTVESSSTVTPNTTQNTVTTTSTTNNNTQTKISSDAQETLNNSTENSANQSTANDVAIQNTTVATQTVTPVTNSTDNSTSTEPQSSQNVVNTTPNNTTENTVTQNTNDQSNETSEEELQAAAGNIYTDVHAIWLNAGDVSKISVSELKNANITDIFVKANMVSTPTYKTVLKDIVSKFQNTGIRIHAWITCFKDANGNWVDPANTTQRQNLLNMITDIAKNYNVDGIHLDYVRYSGVGDNAAYKHEGATETITSFVRDVWNKVKAIDPDIAVSTAVMPEGANNAYIYGQDYAKLAPYVDFIVPMIYKGNYAKDTAWIGTTTKYIVDHAGGKPVIAGLQTYVSDYDTAKLSASELNQDINSAMDNGASGYALFRYGTISEDFINPPSFTLSQIKDAASRVKSYIDKNHKLPNYVTMGTVQVSMSEFLKLMTKGLIQLSNGITTPIKLVGVAGPQESTGTFTTGNINKTEYMDIAKRINAFIDSENNAPNYVSSSLGKVNYESSVYMFAKIFNYYNTNSKLPSYVSMDSTFKISQSTSNGTATTIFTLDQIQKAAANVKKYIDTNHKLPSYVTVGTTRISPEDFLRLMVIGTIELSNRAKMPVSLKDIGTPATPTESIKSGNLTQSAYMDLAQRLKAFIDANGKIPNHATTTLGEIRYESLVYMFAKILSIEDANNRLPGYVSVTPWSVVSSSGTSTSGAGSTITVPAELQKYLAATANCQVTNSQIKALAASITAGKTTTYAKAAAIFNWVRNNLAYSFYYNTKYGAVGALNAKKGNCVDTSHLVIALARAAGIPARYEHVYARFTSGNWYGHVIAQIYVNGKWYYADASSNSNTFGVINNWSTASATVKGYYASLPF
jgi:hypothetical protein